MFKNLCDILKTRVVHGKITSDGNCFFHALEYALGNCDLIPNRPDLYDKTRKEAAFFAIQKIKRQERSLLDEFKQVSRTDEDIARFHQTFEDRLDFLDRFKTNKEYSNEDIIQYTALLKRKILCIVEEEGDHRVSLICPNIPFTSKNIVFLLHSNGNHYITFQYPIHVSDEMVYALKHLPVETVSKEYVITIKDFTLDKLLTFVLTSRIHRRKTENISKNKRKTLTLAQRKLLNHYTLKKKQINQNHRIAIKLNSQFKKSASRRPTLA